MAQRKQRVLITGAAGFIGGYLVEEFLKQGHFVIGIDNFSKYGVVSKSYDNNLNYKFVKGDVKNTSLLINLLKDCDYLIAGAAKIGGIGYFHEFAYDLLAENERIIASTFDAAIHAFQKSCIHPFQKSKYTYSKVCQRKKRLLVREQRSKKRWSIHTAYLWPGRRRSQASETKMV